MQRLIVDGYNLLHAWDRVRRIADRSGLEEARRTLIAILAEYRAAASVAISVVFDSHRGTAASADQVIDGVTVSFGRRGETADHIIERFAYQSTRDGPARDVVVITSDRLLASMVVTMGLATMSAPMFIATVEDALDEGRRARDNTRRTNEASARLEDRVDPETREWLEAWRRGRRPDAD